MKTTLELHKITSGFDEKLILENLNTLEHIWNISVDKDSSSVSFEYMALANLELVRRELYELGYHIINDVSRFDIT